MKLVASKIITGF